MDSKINRKLFVTAASAALIAGCTIPVSSVVSQNSTVYAASEENTITKATKLEKDMTIEGDAVIDADIDLNGHTLTVTGDVLHTSGNISFGNGVMIIKGNYKMQKAEKDSAGDTKYSSCYATLSMKNTFDKLTVGKNFEAHNLYYKCELSNGEFFLNGDVTVDGTINFSEGTKITFDGKDVQKINAKNTTFANVLQNVPSLKFTDEINLVNPRGNINAVSEKAVIYKMDLSSKEVVIDGDVRIGWEKDADVNMNSGSLIVKGNAEHRNGKVILNNGSFRITGNYIMQNADTEKKEYSNCYAVLNVSHTFDKLLVDGDFEVHNLYYESDLSNGELAVSGNISADGTIK